MTTRRNTPTDRTRRVMACLAALLWVLGFEVTPNLHLGLHEHLAPHSHDGVVAHDDHDHEHADHGHAHHHADLAEAHAHHHADSHESAAPEPEIVESTPHAAADDARLDGVSRLDPAHGDHDLLHRGVAIATPPVAQPSIAQAPVVVLARLRPLTDRLASRVPMVARARGPPVLAATCRAVDCTA